MELADLVIGATAGVGISRVLIVRHGLLAVQNTKICCGGGSMGQRAIAEVVPLYSHLN